MKQAARRKGVQTFGQFDVCGDAVFLTVTVEPAMGADVRVLVAAGVSPGEAARALRKVRRWLKVNDTWLSALPEGDVPF
jgi:hypothetical protein